MAGSEQHVGDGGRLEPGDARVTPRSSIPGRLRLDVPALRGNPGLARAVENALRALPHVIEVRASAVSATVLLKLEPSTDPEEVSAAVAAHLDQLRNSTAWSGERPRTPLARILDTAVPQLGELTGPVLLTVGAHSLNMLQGMAFIVSVNVASGEPLLILRKLGVKSARSQLRAVTAASFALTVGEVWAQHLRGKSWRRLARSAEHRLRTRTFAHIEEQDLAFFDHYGTGELLHLLTGQVDSIGALIDASDGLIESLVTVVVAGTSLLKASPGLAIIAGTALPVVLWPGRLLGRRAQAAYTRKAQPVATLTQALENILSGIVEVKSFTAEEEESRRVARLSQEVAELSVTASSAALLQSTVVQNILYLAAALAIGHGSRLVATDHMPQPQLIRAVYWIPLMMRAFGFSVHSSSTYYGAAAAAERLERILGSTPKICSGPTRLARSSVRGEIVFEDVSFGYDRDVPVLRDVSFSVPAGSTLGIVGPNGSGKSTLLRLLLRFYEPDAGRIMLDGHDIRDLDLRDLKDAIALVNQDVYLFDGSVQHNVRYGRPDASDEEVRAALAVDGSADLAAGRDLLTARVGERGHRLSGGQRQQVALARAMLKDAPILALDEATSQLDYQTEAAVKDKLRRDTVHKSVLLVAHRLGSVRDAENIIVLDGGVLVEQGNHQGLLDEGGLYARLWNLQY